MSVIKDVTLTDGTVILIEMEDADVPSSATADFGQPPGTELTSATDKLVDTMKSLQGTLRGVLQVVHEAIKEKAPSEWGVELNIGFKGKTSPIPVIVSGEASASVKVHAKWVKPNEQSSET